MYLQTKPGKEIELIEFIAEMNDLIENGVLMQPHDFILWLEDVQGECVNCYHELYAIVNEYIRNI